ncbi:3'(2'),5'-bisphosphate nucleotidase CysQ [Flavobacteriaceae bacterium MHTCC 0001]
MSELLLIAIKAALKAGEKILEIYSSNDIDVKLKVDDSPLTIADSKANEIINNYLEPTQIPIISEENKQTPYEIRKEWSKCWIVDPLDGTKEFIKRNGEFTVNIAMIENTKPILGVVYVPVTKTLYYAITEDKKAFKCKIKENSDVYLEETLAESLEVRKVNKVKNVIKVVGSRSHKSKATQDFVKNLEQEGNEVVFVSKGSSLKFCVLAEGDANIYPRLAPTMEWDTAAGHAICNAVGLSACQVDKKEELQYNKENLLNPYFIVR